MGIEITRNELTKLNNALNYLIDVVRDVTVRSNDANSKVKYLYESNRIYDLATEDIEKILERNAKT